jgi:ribosomal protein S25
MRNIKHYIFYALLLAGCVFLIVKCNEYRKELSQKDKAEKSVKAKIQTEATEIARKVDEKGIATVLYDITGHKVTPEQASSTTGIKGIIDTTALALDLQTKQLKQILIVKSALEAENLQLKKQLNSQSRPYYTYSGNGLDLKFTPPNDLDTFARADFKANLNLKATQYWKRNWFLGSKKSILAVTSDNPMFNINGADFVEFEQKQPTLGLRIQANTSYNFDTREIGYGPALRLDVGRFSFQGRYSKFRNDPKWKPSVNASYDILRF